MRSRDESEHAHTNTRARARKCLRHSYTSWVVLGKTMNKATVGLTRPLHAYEVALSYEARVARPVTSTSIAACFQIAAINITLRCVRLMPVCVCVRA